MRPLWKKEPLEFVWFALDMTNITIIVVGDDGECPAIPSIFVFLYMFSIWSITMGTLKFIFSFPRPGKEFIPGIEEKYPCLKNILDFMGIGQLLIGIWGIAIIFPNLGYMSDPSEDTCELQPLICGLVIAAIMLLVLLILFSHVAHYVLTGCKRSHHVYQMFHPDYVPEEDGEAEQPKDTESQRMKKKAVRTANKEIDDSGFERKSKENSESLTLSQQLLKKAVSASKSFDDFMA